MAFGILCHECGKTIGAVDAVPDGTEECPGCLGSGSIIGRTKVIPCGRCRGTGVVTRHLCSSCWSRRLDYGDTGEIPLVCAGISLADSVECPQGWQVNVGDCESKHVTAVATRDKKSPCFSCGVGKTLRASLAEEG